MSNNKNHKNNVCKNSTCRWNDVPVVRYSCTCTNSYAAGELAMNSKQLCDKSQVNSNHESARTISFTVKTLMRPLHTRNVASIRTTAPFPMATK